MSTLVNGKSALLLTVLSLIFISASQNLNAQYKTKKPQPTIITKNWIDWIGVFKPEVDSIKRQAFLENLRGQIAGASKTPVKGQKAQKGKICRYLTNYVKKEKIFNVTEIRTQLCPYSDMFVIAADVETRVSDTGTSQPGTPPPTKPKPSGDLIDLLDAFAKNDSVNIYRDQITKILSEKVLEYPGKTEIVNRAVLAILDTGIDTTLLAPGLRSEILWNGPSGSKNFIWNGNPNNYMDDHYNKHGTSVAAIAMNSFYQTSGNTRLPKLMVLKVQDADGNGTLFDYCCGLNYAIKNHATVINSSMGYYGESNPVLDHYVSKCKRDSIPLVTAAGNSNEIRDADKVCSDILNNSNELIAPGHLFFPASMAGNTDLYSVISVTGFRKPGIPCYYQNFSADYVTMGVFNDKTEQTCCMYTLPFIDPAKALEGSSFATPVVSGRLIFKIAELGHYTNIPDYMNRINVLNAPQPPGIQQVTKGNQYISY